MTLKRLRGRLALWSRRRIVDPLLLILRRGTEPKKLAFSAALGITLGIFPICGVTVFLCGISLALVGSHCHTPTVMLANFIATPIELRSLNLFVIFLFHLFGKVDFMITLGLWLALSYQGFWFVLGRKMVITLSFIPLEVLVFYSELLGLRWQMQCCKFCANVIGACLVVPFLRFGEFITGGPHFPLTSDAFKKVLTGQASWEVLYSIFHAMLGWLVSVPVVLGALYLLFLPCFKILVQKFGDAPSPPSTQKKTLNAAVSSSSPRVGLTSPSEVRLKVRGI